MGSWHQVPLDRGDVGVRIDRVLLRHLTDRPGVTRTRLQRLIAGGAVQLSGRVVTRPAARLGRRDTLAIQLPDPAPRTRPIAEALSIDILHEDDDLMIVNKPAGQVSHPAFRNASGTLLNGLLALAGAEWTPALMTRLDKDTSGLVLVAKSRRMQAALQRSLADDPVVKEYVAIVAGRPPARGTITLPLGRDPLDRRRVTVRDRDGRASRTQFRRLRATRGEADGRFSLVCCRLLTGRTHQIRVHLAAMGWPILGDRVYGRPHGAMPRQALHAWRLAFAHPRSHRPIDVTAPLPADMLRLLDEIGLGPQSMRARSKSTVPSAE